MHMDHNPQNCALSNLEFGTHSENALSGSSELASRGMKEKIDQMHRIPSNYRSFKYMCHPVIKNMSALQEGVVLRKNDIPVSYLSYGYRLFLVDRKTLSWYRAVYECISQTIIEDGVVIDHIDNDRCNNAYDNLRPATYQENSHHQVMSKNNTSGMNSVCETRTNKWVCSINLDYHRTAKTFDRKEEAVQWRGDMEIKCGYGQFSIPKPC